MLENGYLMFQDMDAILSGLKKKTYEVNMGLYGEKYKEYFDEILDSVGAAEDKDGVAGAIIDSLCQQVREKYSKKGKISKKMLMNLNFVMIYYIFPTLLLREDENSKLIANNFRDGWNEYFGSSIDYTTYEALLDGFKNRIFGFIIG